MNTSEGGEATTATGAQTQAHRRWVRWVEITTLVAFGLAQPLYSLLGDNPTFLVVHDLRGQRLVVFALAVLLVPVAVLVVLDELLGLAPAPVAAWGRVLLRGVLLGVVVGPPTSRVLGMDGFPALALLATTAGLGAVLFARVEVMARLTRVAVFAVPVFLIGFLAFSPASGLVRGADGEGLAVDAGRTSVVLLAFDQVPLGLLLDGDGNIEAERFPGFARLAASSTWYPQASTVASSTTLSMTSTLSGRFAAESVLPVASEVPVNLFTLLAGTHDVHALENVTQLCPQSVCGETEAEAGAETEPDTTIRDTWIILVRAVLPDAVADDLVPETGDRWRGFGAEEFDPDSVDDTGEATTWDEIKAARFSGDDRERSEAFIDALGTSDGPSLHYLLLEKPHEPLLFLPDGRIYDSCSCYAVSAEGRWPEEPAMSRQRLQRYLLQTMYADQLLGRVLDRLEETGMTDDTMLVVMSDHGASLLPGSINRTLTADNADEVLPVPLFVRYPGQASGAVDTRVAQVTDVLPTIAEILEIEFQDAEFDGRSLLVDTPDDVAEVIVGGGVERLESLPDARRSAYPDWLASLYPDPADPYAQGPAAVLVGTAPATAGDSELQVSVANAGRLDAVDLGADYVPAHLIGELHGASAAVELAVAVNGTIAGVGTTFWNELWRISLMIDPSHLVDGENTIEFYEVTDVGLLRIDGP